ncbi:flavin reductase family protein [Kitasatospora sp. LaBMicrA B282]|uniref:flavin reductase family protein n=1 Tax=Kitasatospora sp. LaBMicrA B282 TaxID=3420949 RepID=UPI003D0F7DED
MTDLLAATQQPDSPADAPLGVSPDTAPDTPPGVSPGRFKRAFRSHPAGVVVITVDAGRGPAGFTATSLSSLSLDPPLLSFAVATRASSWPHLRDAETLVVNFLGAGQAPVAARFATSGIDRFAAPTRWHRLTGGEPALDDTPGLRARVVDRVAAGDHRIVIARVEHTWSVAAHRPLVHHEGTYHAL